jgi:hypothetical protein
MYRCAPASPVSRSGMAPKFSRRGVYVATIVAMVTLVAGFAVAALYNGFGTTTVNGQNAGIVTAPTDTMYHAGFSVTLLASTAASGTCQSGPIAGSGPTSGVETDNIYIAGAANSCPSGTSEWYEAFSFGSIVHSGAATDTFTFATTTGSGTVTSIFTLTLSGTETSEVLTVFVDDGPSASMPIAIDSVSVAASGT